MKHHKPLKQRTYLQDRFEILIKKQEAGNASFNELTELDEIVNRNPAIREKILEEMQDFSGPKNNPEQEYKVYLQQEKSSLWGTIKAFVSRIFMMVSSQLAHKTSGLFGSLVQWFISSLVKFDSDGLAG